MRIICPACGVNMALPDDETGGVVECAGCGKRFRVGEEIDSDHPAEAGTSFKSVVKQPTPAREWRKGIFAGAVGAIATAMLVVIVLVAYRVLSPVPVPAPNIPWDREHRADLLALKATAESQAMAGNWQKSYDAYQQILLMVGDHEVKDPVAVEVIESVRPGQDRAMAGILAGQVAAVPPVAPSSNIEKKPVVVAQSSPVPAVVKSATTRATAVPVGEVKVAQLSATTAPVADLSLAQIAADNAPPLPGPPPPAPSLHAYTLPDAVTDEQIGLAINKGVIYLAGQFRNGEVVSELGPGDIAANHVMPKKLHPQLKENTPAPSDPPSDLDHASDLGDLPKPQPAAPTGQPGGRLPGVLGTGFVAPHTSVFSTPGLDALCVYALLNAGRAQDVQGLGAKDPFTVEILDQLKRYEMPFTYHRSLRAAALGVFNRTEDNAALEEDVRWLQAASMRGAYTYTMPPTADSPWDNSNSQYGLLGVWSGAQAGMAIANAYWAQVEQHWLNCGSGGTWGYDQGTSGSLTMTCAGIASLLVARDYLDAADNFAPHANQPSSSPAIDAGLNWLDTGDNCMSQLPSGGAGGPGYGLYGLERVGLASGFKYFGKHDWYAELAKRLVAEQHFNGSWGGNDGLSSGKSQLLIDTSYALLFLARGRHPILYNKLRYDGDWNNRPHDVAHLANYAAHQLERPLNWQVVNLRRNWFDWMDCPVLYIAGDKAPNFSEADYKAIADFADGGGTIFTHADGGSPEFNKWVAATVRKIFPKYELMQVARDHPLYSVVYPLKNQVPLLSVSNGSRLVLIHSPTDLSGGWQLNWSDEKKPAFQLGVNIFVYAAGKTNLKNRLASSYIPVDPDRADSSRQIARLRYPGEWDPEPYAWTRFSRYFQWEMHQAIEPVTVDMKMLKPGSVPMAVLTGTVRHDFTDAENAAVSAYVQAGGVLIIDACGGQADFTKCVETTLMPNAFAGATFMPIAPTHPLLVASRGGANDLSKPMLRGYANENGGKNLPIEACAYGNGWVIFSRLDLTTGLLGTQSWGILGFDSAYAQALMKNAVLWAEARSPTAEASTK